MIVKMIIEMLLQIVRILLGAIGLIVPVVDIAEYMLDFTEAIITICTQANNFLHFMLGDFVVVLIPTLIALLVYKYGIYPIIVVIRSVFVNGNN